MSVSSFDCSGVSRRLVRLALVTGLSVVALPSCGGEHVPPTPRLVADGAADGIPPWYTCTVVAGDGDDSFFRADTLSCAAEADALFAPSSLDVWASDGDYVGGLRFDEPRDLRFYADGKYPLRLVAKGFLDGDVLFGGEPASVTIEYSITAAEDAAVATGPERPFDVWQVHIRNQSNFGLVRVEPREISLRGATGDSGATTLALRHDSLLLRGDEAQSIAIPVSDETEEVILLVGEQGQEVPFTLTGPGSFVVTPDGLVDEADLPGAAAGPAIVSCERGEGDVLCNVVARDGVVVGTATVAGVDLPVDGTAVSVPDQSELLASVTVREGIAGVDWSRAPAIEGVVTLEDGAGTLDLPFDLVSVGLELRGDLSDAFFDVRDHRVRLRRAWGNHFELDDGISAWLTPLSTLWIAVSPEQTEVSGTLGTLTGAGAYAEHAVTLVDGQQLLITPEGVVVPETPASGAEIARTWWDPEGRLAYQHAAAFGQVETQLIIRSATLGRDVTIDLDPGDTGISFSGLPNLLPLELVLRSDALGGIEVSRQVDSLDQIAASAPLLLTAP